MVGFARRPVEFCREGRLGFLFNAVEESRFKVAYPLQSSGKAGVFAQRLAEDGFFSVQRFLIRFVVFDLTVRGFCRNGREKKKMKMQFK